MKQQVKFTKVLAVIVAIIAVVVSTKYQPQIEGWVVGKLYKCKCEKK